MKEYKVQTIRISTISSTAIEIVLNNNAQSGWHLKQIVINESTDQYIIILEKG